MKVLLINKFLYPKGGAEISTLTTGKLLSEKGHDVFFWGMKHPANPEYPYAEYFVENIDYEGVLSIKQKISSAFKILYSFEAKNKIEQLVYIIKPDIVHLNNFAHQISPSILHIFKKRNIPTIMTLRDYKLVCPSYSMLADGRICESCKNSRYYYCLIKKCTKGSYAKSLVNTVEMYLNHKVLNSYDLIDIYISPSMFLKNKVKEMGFERDVAYLPNFINPIEFTPNYGYENEFCYFGRLSREKGLVTLIDAVTGCDVDLKVIGSGSLEGNLKVKVTNKQINNVKFLGYKTGDELKNEIKKSMAIIIPSEWYENNPRAVLESFALGKPVIGARIGGIPELVMDGKTGYTFEPGNVKDLRDKIEDLKNNPMKISEMGRNARRFVEENFNSEKHYQELIKIYQMAMEKN